MDQFLDGKEDDFRREAGSKEMKMHGRAALDFYDIEQAKPLFSCFVMMVNGNGSSKSAPSHTICTYLMT